MFTQEIYDYYTFDHDKHMFSGRSGKQRSKRESATHTNWFDPSGHSRKISTKLRNTELKKKDSSKKSKGRAAGSKVKFAF